VQPKEAPSSRTRAGGFFAYLNEDLANKQVNSVPLEAGDDGGG
jgi:hypothetical protein